VIKIWRDLTLTFDPKRYFLFSKKFAITWKLLVRFCKLNKTARELKHAVCAPNDGTQLNFHLAFFHDTTVLLVVTVIKVWAKLWSAYLTCFQWCQKNHRVCLYTAVLHAWLNWILDVFRCTELPSPYICICTFLYVCRQ